MTCSSNRSGVLANTSASEGERMTVNIYIYIFKGLRPCSADPLHLVSVFQHGADMVFVAMV